MNNRSCGEVFRSCLLSISGRSLKKCKVVRCVFKSERGRDDLIVAMSELNKNIVRESLWCRCYNTLQIAPLYGNNTLHVWVYHYTLFLDSNRVCCGFLYLCAITLNVTIKKFTIL